MLNRTGVRKESFANEEQILWAIGENVSVGVVVSNATYVTDGMGRKIVKKGTPLVGNLDTRTTPFTIVTGSNEASVVGVLVHDVDVSSGNANGTLLISGYVNTSRIDTTTVQKISANVKKALPRITFMKA